MPWGPLDDAWLQPPPTQSKWARSESLYRGQRVVVTRQAMARFGPYSRLESSDFTYRQVMLGIPLQQVPGWKAKLVLAVLLSSLGRYQLYMTAGRWGPWFDDVTKEDILALPVRIPDAEDDVARRVIAAVDKLRSHSGSKPDWTNGSFISDETDAPAPLVELNDAVFDLFELTDAQRDLVSDFHDHFLRPDEANRTRDRRVELPKAHEDANTRWSEEDLSVVGGIGPYLRAFIAGWERELGGTSEFSWAIRRGDSVPVLCAVFSLHQRGKPASTALGTETNWREVVSRLQTIVSRPVSRQLAVEGVVRAVTSTDIIIVKRDEQRLWTASAAREDVEASMLQTMRLQGR